VESENKENNKEARREENDKKSAERDEE